MKIPSKIVAGAGVLGVVAASYMLHDKNTDSSQGVAPTSELQDKNTNVTEILNNTQELADYSTTDENVVGKTRLDVSDVLRDADKVESLIERKESLTAKRQNLTEFLKTLNADQDFSTEFIYGIFQGEYSRISLDGLKSMEGGEIKIHYSEGVLDHFQLEGDGYDYAVLFHSDGTVSSQAYQYKNVDGINGVGITEYGVSFTYSDGRIREYSIKGDNINNLLQSNAIGSLGSELSGFSNALEYEGFGYTEKGPINNDEGMFSQEIITYSNVEQGTITTNVEVYLDEDNLILTQTGRDHVSIPLNNNVVLFILNSRSNSIRNGETKDLISMDQLNILLEAQEYYRNKQEEDAQ